MTVSKLVYIEFTVDIDQPAKSTKVANSYGSRSPQTNISNLIQTCDAKRTVLYLLMYFHFRLYIYKPQGHQRGLEDP